MEEGAQSFTRATRLKYSSYSFSQVVDAVHAKGSFIYLQLWALGRAATPDVLDAEGPYPYVSASDVKLDDKPFPPRPLTGEGEHHISLISATLLMQTP